jgi:hypothetical protein
MTRDAQPSAGELPSRDDVLPKSYALHITKNIISVWQFRPTMSDPAGDWYHVETLQQNNTPRFNLEYATIENVGGSDYWIYTKSYECRLDCD